jgi:beta-lactamase regulating signal transducer with metallopeptidase domain
MLALGSSAALATAPEMQRTSPEGGLIAGDPRNAAVESGERGSAVTGIAHVRLSGARVISRLYNHLTPYREKLDSLNGVLLALWAAISALLAGVAAYALVEGRRLRLGLRPADVEGTPVLLTEAIGPATVGMYSPAILLPRWALDLDETLLRLVLRHEREHLEARDPLLLLIGSLALVLMPWHMPLWWSWRRLRLAIEVDCDARVLRANPDVRRYAELLLLTGQRGSTVPWSKRPTFAVVAPLRPHVAHLTKRIRVMTQHASRSTARSLLLVGAAVASATVALALPAPQPLGGESQQSAEIVGLYLMVPPHVPSMKMLAPGREFTYLRLAPDGRSRMENVTVDASGDVIAPTVEVARWSTQNWKVIPATADTAAQLCWELGSRMLCGVYQRDPESGDITLYRDAIGGKVELVLRRASSS